MTAYCYAGGYLDPRDELFLGEGLECYRSSESSIRLVSIEKREHSVTFDINIRSLKTIKDCYGRTCKELVGTGSRTFIR